MIRKIVIYGVGTFFSKIVVFLLVPIYTRVLDPTKYGTYDVAYSTMQMLVSICYLELWSGTLRFLFDCRGEKQKYQVVKTTAVLCIPLTFLLYISTNIIRYWLDLVDIPTMLVFGIAYAMFNITNNICRGIGENLLYVISGIISSLCSCGGGVIFIVVCKLGAEALLWASSIGYIVAIVYVEHRCHCFSKAIQERIDWSLGKSILLYSFPLFINSIAFSFLTTYDKGLIANMLGTRESGLYATVNKFTTAISIIGTIFQLAWQEQAFSMAASKGNKRVVYQQCIDGHIRFMGYAMPICALMLVLSFPLLVGKEYLQAFTLVPLAIWGTYLSALSGVLGSYFSAEKQTGAILLSTVCGAVINVIVVMNLLQKIGVDGVNVALILGFGAICLIRMILIFLNIKVKCKSGLCTGLCISYAECTVVIKSGSKVMMLSHLVIYTVLWVLLNISLIKLLCNKVINFLGRKNGGKNA